MQFVFGILTIVIALELFSAGNGANIPYQNRGYIIDIPSRLIRGNKQWSENYYRQEPYTNNNPTNPVHQYPDIKKRPNYLGYKDKPSTYHAALQREHSKQESGQIHRNLSLLVPFWYPNNDKRPSDNYFTNLVQYGNRYPSQDLNHPHLSTVYYHPQTTGYNPVPPRIVHPLDERPRYHTKTQYYPPSANHLDYNLPPPSPERYHSPIHRKSIYHHPKSGAGPSFPPTHPGIPPPPPPPIRLGESPLQQPTHLRVMSLMPFLTHPGIPQPQPPHLGVAPRQHTKVALPLHLHSFLAPPPPPPRGVAPPSPLPHSEVAPSPPHRGVAPPSIPPYQEVAPPPYPQPGVAPPHTRLVLPPSHARVASPPQHPGVAPPPPLPHTRVVTPQPHSRVASPPPHQKMAPPSPSPPRYLGVVPDRFPQYNQQRRQAYSADIYSNESDDYKTLSSYVKKNQYKPEGKTTLSIYQHMPKTFWKTTGYFRKDRTKRSIRDEDDLLHDWEFGDDHLHDWEFDEEEYAEHGDQEEGYGIHDSTDVHERKKRWASDEDNGDCQDCTMSNASGGEVEYSADPWNYDDNDSGESRQIETWNSGSNNNDYTWNNDDNNNSGESSQTDTWSNDGNNNNGESSQTDTWSNDGNNNNGENSQADTWSNDDDNDEYSWNNDDILNNDDDETDSIDNTDDNDYTAQVSNTPAVQKPRPHPPPPEHNRPIAYPRRPPSRRAPEHGPQPKPHPPKPQNRPGSVHDRRPNPRPPKSDPPQRRPGPLNGPSPGHSNPTYTLPIPPAPPRHPKSPSYPSEHLQYDWDYEECED